MWEMKCHKICIDLNENHEILNNVLIKRELMKFYTINMLQN